VVGGGKYFRKSVRGTTWHAAVLFALAFACFYGKSWENAAIQLRAGGVSEWFLGMFSNLCFLLKRSGKCGAGRVARSSTIRPRAAVGPELANPGKAESVQELAIALGNGKTN